jgi:hypothetical protein
LFVKSFSWDIVGSKLAEEGRKTVDFQWERVSLFVLVLRACGGSLGFQRCIGRLANANCSLLLKTLDDVERPEELGAKGKEGAVGISKPSDTPLKSLGFQRCIGRLANANCSLFALRTQFLRSLDVIESSKPSDTPLKAKTPAAGSKDQDKQADPFPLEVLKESGRSTSSRVFSTLTSQSSVTTRRRTRCRDKRSFSWSMC